MKSQNFGFFGHLPAAGDAVAVFESEERWV